MGREKGEGEGARGARGVREKREREKRWDGGGAWHGYVVICVCRYICMYI